MKKLLLGGTVVMMAALAIAVFSSTPAGAVCDECDNPATTDNGEFTIELIGGAPTVDGDLVTYTYEVCKEESNRDLSHWVLGIDLDCIGDYDLDDLIVSVKFNGEEIDEDDWSTGLDPTTGLDGFKFDVGFECEDDEDCCATYELVLDQSLLAPGWKLGAGCIEGAWKAGQNVGRFCFLDPVCEEDVVEPNCETAWGFGEALNEIPAVVVPQGKGFREIKITKWGWYFEVPAGEGIEVDLWAAAGQNDLNKGTKAGTVKVSRDGDEICVEFDLETGFTLDEAHVWYGTDLAELVKIQAAPGQFQLPDEDGNLCFEWDEDEAVYIAAHGVVCTIDWD